MERAKVISVEDIRTHTVPGGGVLKMITTETDTGLFAFTLATYEPGKGHVWHYTERSDEAMYIIKGNGTLFYKEDGVVKSLEYKEGDALFLKAGTRHQNINTGNEKIILLSVLAPYAVAKEE